jgi:hypothetical protein
VSHTPRQHAAFQANREKAWMANRERAIGDPVFLTRQLEQLLKFASDNDYYQAVTILRMHLRAAKLDCSLDALRRGEL